MRTASSVPPLHAPQRPLPGGAELLPSHQDGHATRMQPLQLHSASAAAARTAMGASPPPRESSPWTPSPAVATLVHVSPQMSPRGTMPRARSGSVAGAPQEILLITSYRMISYRLIVNNGDTLIAQSKPLFTQIAYNGCPV